MHFLIAANTREALRRDVSSAIHQVYPGFYIAGIARSYQTNWVKQRYKYKVIFHKQLYDFLHSIHIFTERVFSSFNVCSMSLHLHLSQLNHVQFFSVLIHPPIFFFRMCLIVVLNHKGPMRVSHAIEIWIPKSESTSSKDHTIGRPRTTNQNPKSESRNLKAPDS